MKHASKSNRRSGLGYFIREGFSSIFVHGFTSFAAITVIAACLLVTGTFSLVAYNIDQMILGLEAQSEIFIYIDDSVSRQEALALESRVRAIPNVKSVQFITKEQLFEEYLLELGEDAYVMEELREDNPLRDSYRVEMKDVALHAETVEKLESITGVASSNSDKEVSDRLIQIRGLVNMVSYVLIGLLGAVSIFIIANTVKLAMFARREEIAIMKMVGATNSFIRAPFVVEGMVLGVSAALLAFLCQWGVYNYITKELVQGSAIFNMVPFADFLRPLLLTLLAAGVVLGVLGSVLTIRRFLKV